MGPSPNRPWSVLVREERIALRHLNMLYFSPNGDAEAEARQLNGQAREEKVT